MKSILAVALLFAATCINTASAQNRRVQAQIPFSFAAGNSTLPPGTYIVRSDFGSNFVTLENWSKHIRITTLTMPDEVRVPESSKLVFHRYGDQYFLSEIRCEGTSLNVHLSTSKAEKMARKQTLEAGLNTDNTVLIALN